LSVFVGEGFFGKGVGLLVAKDAGMRGYLSKCGSALSDGSGCNDFRANNVTVRGGVVSGRVEGAGEDLETAE
jgi:hypothetical protein